MHKVSDLYRTLFAERNHRKEVRFDVAGVEHGENRIVSASISGGLFSHPGIGNCASRQLDAQILPAGDIPRQAKIQVFVRLTLGDQSSEWIPKGVFFISTRKRDKRTGTLTITAYDAMLKAEETWLTPDYNMENWPMSQKEAVADIAQRMGVAVDGRTALSSQFPVDYPVAENGDLTMREVLGYIAVSNAGNWIITDAGGLLLIGYGDIPAETNYLVTENGGAILFGEVRILV